jgi:hypothetical protein
MGRDSSFTAIHGAACTQGIGGGLLLSLCYLAIQQWFGPSWWSRLFGFVSVIWGAGSLLVLAAATSLIAESGVAPRIPVSIAEALLGAALLYYAARLDLRSPSRLFPSQLMTLRHPVGAAAVGIAANLSGLAAGISIAAMKAAAFWVFAAFIPVLMLALICAWQFTREP